MNLGDMIDRAIEYIESIGRNAMWFGVGFVAALGLTVIL